MAIKQSFTQDKTETSYQVALIQNPWNSGQRLLRMLLPRDRMGSRVQGRCIYQEAAKQIITKLPYHC